MANSKNTLTTVLAVIVTLVVAGAGGYMLGNRAGQPEAKAVATVNGEAITETELYNVMVKEQGQATLDRLITTRLVNQEAKKNNVSVSDAEIDEELNKTKEALGGEDMYQQALQTYGMSEESLKESILLTLQAQKILGKDIQVTDEELNTFFSENQSSFDKRQLTARHILVKTEEEAKAIKAQLDGGADFATLAKEKSTDTGSAANGGDLGTFGRGRMVAEFEDVAFAMSEGQISDPVQSTFGWHIIQVQKIEGAAPDLAAQKEEVKEQYVAEKVGEQLSTWLQELRTNAQITNTLG